MLDARAGATPTRPAAGLASETMLVDVKRSTVEEMLAESGLFGQAQLAPAVARSGARGTLITAIRQGGVVALIGLRDGDIIVEINGRPADIARDLRDGRDPANLPAFVDLTVERGGRPMRILVLLHG